MSAWRPSGIVVIGLLVASGVGVTAGYMQWKAPEVGELIAGRRREIAAAPKTTEGRLTQWLVYGVPQVHHRLTLMRFSAEQPWLVTHAIGKDPDSLAIHGIDLAAMPKEIAWVEGQAVRMRFPRPVLLARGPLTGPNAMSVPVAAAEESAPDGIERARHLIRFALDGLTQALERDIPGTQVSIGIGPEESWAEIAADRARR
ncbi:MAG: hypothetical protein ACKVXR_18965 [Planctomycetota bacterium]